MKINFTAAQNTPIETIGNNTASIPMQKPSDNKEQQALLLYFSYRLLIGLALLAVIQSGHGMYFLAEHQPQLFRYAGYSYLFLAIISGILLKTRWLNSTSQIQLMFIVDTITIPVLMYAGIGITSGMGTLLAVSLALTSLIVSGTLVLFFAAIATFAIFTQLLLVHGIHGATPNQLTHAGFLGAAFFFIAALSGYLSHRVRVSESLAIKQAADLADLARLNQLIIEQMATGVIVVNGEGIISYINDAAKRLMRIPAQQPAVNLKETVPELYQCLQQWCKDKSSVNRFTVSTGRNQLLAHIKESGLGENKAPLVFLQDASEAVKQAQQLKLASLGRLTASIAHQIRNPLSSINHAGQLLAESDTIAQPDKRLTEIIQNNSSRVNAIIESILKLSKQQESEKKSLPLQPWLNDFIKNLLHQEALEKYQVVLATQEPMKCHSINVDPVHLDQILGNLCENSVRHYNGPKNDLSIELKVVCNTNQEITLDILDNGKGFPSESQEQLFEPFFTTRSNGTGLGLYIAKELCEANGIEISVIPHDTGAHFRLRFARDNG